MSDKREPARRPTKRLIPAIALAATLAGCSGVQPYSYTPIDEIPPGPGLFSGEDGEFVLYSR